MTATPWGTAVTCLACPHCGAPPRLLAGGVACARGHRFDLAREGYLHLLPGTGRRPALAGDSRAMLRARRGFLARGYYDAIADALAAQLASVPSTGCIVDAGCGEGFYLGRIQSRLAQPGTAMPALIGLDISRDAVRLAARAYPRIAFAVADIAIRLPLRDGCADALLNIFAPRNPAEFARVVRPLGHVVVIIPTDEHLSGLRDHVALLRIEPDKREHIAERLADSFTLTAAMPVRYDVSLTGPDAALLVAMSPTARHLPAATIAELAARHEPISTPVSVEMLAFQRRP